MFMTLEEHSLLLNCRGQVQFIVDVLLPTTLHHHVAFLQGDDQVLHYFNDRLLCSFVHQIRFCEDPCEFTQRVS